MQDEKVTTKRQETILCVNQLFFFFVSYFVFFPFSAWETLPILFVSYYYCFLATRTNVPANTMKRFVEN